MSHLLSHIYKMYANGKRECVAANLGSVESNMWFRAYDEFKGWSNPLNKKRGFYYTCGPSWSSDIPSNRHTDFPVALTITT